jgi:hypothetical protein
MSYHVEIEIDQPHAEIIDDILTEIESGVEAIRDRLNNADDRIVHTANIDDLLANQHAIAIVWDIQHVKDQRPDLGKAQAWEVLQECQRSHDRLNDPMLETIRQVADNLCPQQPKARHVKAAGIITEYGNGIERENLVDLLADMMLWCQAFGEPFDNLCDTARMHFAEETNSQMKGIKP